jgi:tetratricopeptide (TPR) repeat protein
LKPSSTADIESIDLTRPLEMVALGVKEQAVRCRLLDGEGDLLLRASGIWDVVPGEILTVMPRKTWRFGGFPYLSGDIQAQRQNVIALGLQPLQLEDQGQWDPHEHYWAEEGERLKAWEEALIAGGPRPLFEMEQVLPGEDPDNFDWDPILESVDRKEAGDYQGAEGILMAELEADLRCLDAHAHLGNLCFKGHPDKAIRHYSVGALIGELSLGEGFDGVLSWGLTDNRPFLRCMNGYGLCLWRLERFDDAATVFERMLRLNPSDNQGVRFLIDSIRARIPWSEDGETWEEGRAMRMHTLAEIPPWEWPVDANDDILRVLADVESPEAERLLAAELAGDLTVMNDVLAEELLRILASPGEPETLRARAAISLGPAVEEGEIGGFEEPDILAVTEGVLRRAKASLRELYHDPEIPKKVRRCALEASVRAPEPWHPGAIRAAFHDPDPEWRLTAVFCMRFVQGFADEIVEALGDDDTEVLYQAVCAAADQGVDGAWPYVRRLVLAAASGALIVPDDPDAEWSILLAAMNAVASIRPLEAHETLSGLVESDDEEISEAAIEVLDMVEGLWMDEDEDDYGEDEPTWH